MAILKDLIVSGVSRFIGSVFGSEFVVNGGTSSQFLKADGSLDGTTYCANNDSRLSNSRPASDVYSWAKASTKPSYTANEVGAIANTINTTWANLKSLRDNSTLKAGQWYRITDYVTTTIQTDTQSAGHQFDVIVRADDVNVLNENAFAAKHSGDTYFTNASAKLEAWELKYCLDNDTNKFAWADATNGKGVIYWMKDEWNNECSYDFKNIQFKVGAPPQSGIVANVFYYTFSVASGTNDATVTDHSLNGLDCYNNRIGKYISFSVQALNFIVFRNTSTTNSCYSNTFGENCYYNVFGGYCHNNAFGMECLFNAFGMECYSNTFGFSCCFNTFGDSYLFNAFGNSCYANTFNKNYCRFIIIESGNRNITLTSTQTTSNSNYLQNIKICQGVNNTTTTKTISHDTVNDTFLTEYKPINSQVISV